MKYVYFVHFTIPSGDGNIILSLTERVTKDETIGEMRDFIKKQNNLKSVVISNFIFLREEED
jgi:hypothetical protein